METSIGLALLIIGLLLGGIAGAVAFSSQTEVEVPVEKIVNVEKVIEVPGETITINSTTVLNQAVDDLLEYMDDEDLFMCDGQEYDDSEVSVSKVYDEYSINYEEDEYTVSAEIKLKFDEDDEKSCRDRIEFSVRYEEDEDPEIAII